MTNCSGRFWVYVAAIVVVLVTAVALFRPLPSEPYRAKVDITELVGRQVKVVRSMPPASARTPGTVYLVVDAKMRLVSNPKLPFEGEPLATVQRLLLDKFGERTVRVGTMRPADPRARADKVWILYDAQTRLVTKVMVPRRWAMPPRIVDVRRKGTPTYVALNPPAGSKVRGRTLIIHTRAGNTARSASVVG